MSQPSDVERATVEEWPCTCPSEFHEPEKYVNCARARGDRLTRELREAQEQKCSHGWRGARPDSGDRIAMPCPSCGMRALFIGTGGHLTCSSLECKEPGVELAVADLRSKLDAAEHEREHHKSEMAAAEKAWKNERERRFKSEARLAAALAAWREAESLPDCKACAVLGAAQEPQPSEESRSGLSAELYSLARRLHAGEMLEATEMIGTLEDAAEALEREPVADKH